MNMRNWLRKGFTLIEVLAVVAVISVVASAGYYTATSVRESARESKLESDVASLNSAVQIYEAAGGNFTDLPDGDGDDTRLEAKVLNKLKVKADAEAISKFNGITGSVVDARLMAGDSSDSGKRAYWDVAARRFLIAESDGGPDGVREFFLSDDAVDASRSLGANIAGSYIRADRALDASNLKEGPKWVWEHSGATVLAKNEVPIPDPVVPAPTAFPVPDASVAPTPVTTATPFVPTPPPTPDPTPAPGGGGSGLPAGVLLGSLTIHNNSQLNGNVTLINYESNMQYSGDWKINGNLYLPGTPNIYTDWVAADRRWEPTPQKDALFANRILGKQYNEQGTEIVPPDPGWSPTPRVVDMGLAGQNNPVYNIVFYNNNQVKGKIYRQSKTVTLPTVDPPGATTAPPGSKATHNSTYNPPPMVIDPNVYESVEVQRPIAVTLLPGNYKTLRAGVAGAEIVLGAPGQVQHYSFDSIDLSGGASIRIEGEVVITVRSPLKIHDNGYVGNSQHPEWLRVNVYSPNAPSNTEQVTISQGAFYGTLVAPKGGVVMHNYSKFAGAISAYSLTVTGNVGMDINLDLSPVAGN